MKKFCQFCQIASGIHTKNEDKILFETPNYFSIASIGTIVDGWVLLAPKQHTLSMSPFYDDREFKLFAERVICKLKKKYNMPIISFEHSPNNCDSATSCGTNHAHLHLVPYSRSLYPMMISSGLKWKSCHASQIKNIAKNCEYLFYSDPTYGWDNHSGYISILTTPISQYFRRIIAKQLGFPEIYDYKKFPFYSATIATIESLYTTKKII